MNVLASRGGVYIFHIFFGPLRLCCGIDGVNFENLPWPRLRLVWLLAIVACVIAIPLHLARSKK